MKNFFGIFSNCPYTMLFKKTIRMFRGERWVTRTEMNDRERYLLGRVRLGQGIALVGIFCPIFWISLLTGFNRKELYFNAIHSGIVVLSGLGFMLKYRMDLEKL